MQKIYRRTPCSFSGGHCVLALLAGPLFLLGVLLLIPMARW